MVHVTEIQLQQDGNTVLVQFDSKYVRGCPAIELLDDRTIEAMRRDIELNIERVREAKNRFCGSNIIAFPPSAPRAPIGLGDGNA